MKISLKKIAQFFKAKNSFELLSRSSDSIRNKLALSGLEVELASDLSLELKDIRIAKIESITKHPNADKLNVCVVNTGKEKLQIVCGASNVRKNLFVAFAPVGAVLPGNFKIKKSKIRDVESFGMLCSSEELGLSEKSEGILELGLTQDDLGKSFVEVMDFNDQLWDFELTPDRSDCLSHLGIAREVQRYLGFQFEDLEFKKLDPENQNDVPLFDVEVLEEKAAPFYSAMLLDGFQGQETPQEILSILKTLSIREHSFAVDLANYVLFERGLPMHSFDVEKIVGSKLIVRKAKNGEKITTLDGVERVLSDEDLVIADLEKVVALAGIMGSEDSAVTAETKQVVLEAAYFDPDTIRNSVQRHQIHSDASFRFERGVDPDQVLKAAARFQFLAEKFAGVKQRGAFVARQSKHFEALQKNKEIHLDLRALNRILGLSLEGSEVKKYLDSVTLLSDERSNSVLKVSVPAFRHDIERQIDLVEEVARLYGFSKIPSRFPILRKAHIGRTEKQYCYLQFLKKKMSSLALTEIMPYSFCSEEELKSLDQLKKSQLVGIKNPLSRDWAYMRPSLAFGSLNNFKLNTSLNQWNSSYFEVGSVFKRVSRSESDKNTPATDAVCEDLHLSILLSGKSRNLSWAETEKKIPSFDFYDLKGRVEEVIKSQSKYFSDWASLKLIPLTEENLEIFYKDDVNSWVPFSLLHPFQSAVYVKAKSRDEIVGYLGALHPTQAAKKLNLPAQKNIRVFMAELKLIKDRWNLEDIFPDKKVLKSKSISRYPIVERDLAFVAPKDILYSDLIRVIESETRKYLLGIECVDRYEINDTEMSLSLRMYFQNPEKTMDEKEIDALQSAILSKFQKKFSIGLRPA